MLGAEHTPGSLRAGVGVEGEHPHAYSLEFQHRVVVLDAVDLDVLLAVSRSSCSSSSKGESWRLSARIKNSGTSGWVSSGSWKRIRGLASGDRAPDVQSAARLRGVRTALRVTARPGGSCHLDLGDLTGAVDGLAKATHCLNSADHGTQILFLSRAAALASVSGKRQRLSTGWFGPVRPFGRAARRPAPTFSALLRSSATAPGFVNAPSSGISPHSKPEAGCDEASPPQRKQPLFKIGGTSDAVSTARLAAVIFVWRVSRY